MWEEGRGSGHVLILLSWTTKPKDNWYTSSDVLREPYRTELVGRQEAPSAKPNRSQKGIWGSS